jgi:cytochrome P450
MRKRGQFARLSSDDRRSGEKAATSARNRSCHRKFWEHPTAFMPERFAGKPSPWTAIGAYLPFGAGPRTCIEAIFAMSEAHIVMATLLRRYRGIIGDDLRQVRPVARITIEPNFAPMFRLERV